MLQDTRGALQGERGRKEGLKYNGSRREIENEQETVCHLSELCQAVC